MMIRISNYMCCLVSNGESRDIIRRFFRLFEVTERTFSFPTGLTDSSRNCLFLCLSEEAAVAF